MAAPATSGARICLDSFNNEQRSHVSISEGVVMKPGSQRDQV